MQILKVNGTDWCERRLMRKFYTDQRIKLKLDQWRQEEKILEEKLEKDAVSHRFYSTFTANTLPRQLLKTLETAK
jgi:hypothetical protein